MLRSILVFFILLVLGQPVFSQARFNKQDSIVVLSGTDTLLNAWTGGLNSCQFSEIDLDGDGILDLFVFDRLGPDGGRITTFLNKGTPNKVAYVSAPQYVSKFPPIQHWALLADYNCDGKADLFTSTVSGIALYKNTSTPTGGLSFQLVSPLIMSNYGSSPNLNLYVSIVDIPAIVDIDGDGDLDIITYSINGTYAEYHKNGSMEKYGVCDSLNQYVKQRHCFGHYGDANGCSNYITQHIDSCLVNLAPDPGHGNADIVNSQHSGTCLLCISEDGDKDKDLVIGHVLCTNLTEMRNVGDTANAVFGTTDYTFPSYDVPLNLNVFACGYLVDVNNDGKKDMLVSPNQVGATEDFNSIVWYKNKGKNDSLVLSYQQNNFLQDKMIDVGEGAFPVLHDYDNDGLADLFIGNLGYYASTGLVSQIALFRNTGTASKPRFTLVTRDFANLSTQHLPFTGFALSFGDLDGDGDADLVIGDDSGILHYFENQGGALDNYVYKPTYFNNLHVGQYATPQLIDLNRDGKLDIVSGNRQGNIYYFQNTGSTTVPVFSSTATATKLGGVDTKTPGYIGNSAPFFYSEAGSYKLLVGSESGHIYRYGNIDGNLSGNFSRLDTNVSHIAMGYNSVPYGYDLDGDGVQDLMVGNYGGGVTFFKGDNSLGIATLPDFPAPDFVVYPNPASDNFTLHMLDFNSASTYTLTITDLRGRVISSTKIRDAHTSVSTTALSSGMYMCSVLSGGAVMRHKLLVRH
jgi:hypothetical protein